MTTSWGNRRCQGNWWVKSIDICLERRNITLKVYEFTQYDLFLFIFLNESDPHDSKTVTKHSLWVTAFPGYHSNLVTVNSGWRQMDKHPYIHRPSYVDICILNIYIFTFSTSFCKSNCQRSVLQYIYIYILMQFFGS